MGVLKSKRKNTKKYLWRIRYKKNILTKNILTKKYFFGIYWESTTRRNYYLLTLK